MFVVFRLEGLIVWCTQQVACSALISSVSVHGYMIVSGCWDEKIVRAPEAGCEAMLLWYGI